MQLTRKPRIQPSIICSFINEETYHNVLALLDCVDDDYVRGFDIFVDEEEEIESESEIPYCVSAQAEFEKLQPGPSKKGKNG